jgi:2-amino-4-hydroxy-6-hydroxymethyldihydropteridine diphosphokinase
MQALVALGANVAGRWGTPAATLVEAVRRLSASGLRVVKVSALYETAPIGRSSQPRYRNAVVQIQAALPPARMLALFKQVERQAGRRPGPRWGPRPLDLDLIAYGRLRAGRQRLPGRSRRTPPPTDRALVLPHPQVAERRFVLVPLLDVAPYWRHPVSGLGARDLLCRLPRPRGEIVRSLDAWPFS